MVYLRSHRGEYLAVREDTNWGPGVASTTRRQANDVGIGWEDVGYFMDLHWRKNMQKMRSMYIDFHDLHDLSILSSLES